MTPKILKLKILRNNKLYMYNTTMFGESKNTNFIEWNTVETAHADLV